MLHKINFKIKVTTYLHKNFRRVRLHIFIISSLDQKFGNYINITIKKKGEGKTKDFWRFIILVFLFC